MHKFFRFPWSKLKPLFMQKLTAVMEEWFEFMPMEEMSGSPNVENVSFAVMRDRVLATVNSFTG